MTEPTPGQPKPGQPRDHGREAEAALARARELLRNAGPLDEATRANVLAALSDLARAIEPAIGERPEDARSVTHFAETIAHEATHPAPSRSILTTALEGLDEAAERLGQKYPTVAGIVERMSNALAQIGI